MSIKKDFNMVNMFRDCYQDIGGNVEICKNCKLIIKFIYPEVFPEWVIRCGSFCPSVSPGDPAIFCHCHGIRKGKEKTKHGV